MPLKLKFGFRNGIIFKRKAMLVDPEAEDEISRILLEQMYHHLSVTEIRDVLLSGHKGKRRQELVETLNLTCDLGTEFDLDLVELGDAKAPLSDDRISKILLPLRLEKYLRCVWIPYCRYNTPSEGCLQRIFHFLRETKKVRRIMRLEVNEDMDHPHSDDAIVKSIKGFEIEELDWKKTDMCSSVIVRAIPEVKILRLYSSGNNAVLRSWSAPDGLCSLDNVRFLTSNKTPMADK